MNNRTPAIKLGLCALAHWAVVAAQAAAPIITNLTTLGGTPQFGVQSDVGITNQIQCCTNLSQTNWLVLTNLLVAQSSYWFLDIVAQPAPCRFYRIVAFPTNNPAPTGMVLIPTGNFTMGNCMDTNEGDPEELPLHTVYVSAFYMDTNLVSYALWQQVCQWATNHGYAFDNPGSGKAGNHPVQMVGWYDVAKWCNARSEMLGLTPCYYTNSGLTGIYRTGQVALTNALVGWTCNGCRLPTEAEWEKAARGGASGHRFPWTDADTINWDRANYFANPSGCPYDVNPTSGENPLFGALSPFTSPAGFFAANAYGLYDMAGNVWQWCWDWYDPHWYNAAEATQNDTRGPASKVPPGPFGGTRVLRGGSWIQFAVMARCATRGDGGPAYGASDTGFRCVRRF